MTTAPYSKLPAYSLTEKRVLVRHWGMSDTPESVIIDRLKVLWRQDRNRMASDKRMYAHTSVIGGPHQLDGLCATFPRDRGQIGQDYPGTHLNLIDDNIIPAPVRHLPTGERNGEDGI